ncbi:MAG: hypothetical protein D6732_13725 [Methanobacteriota archaeon]|nr:MAG: hypothetical protein D6732_13725 [Euryarchaeota archaeon]
MAYKIRESPLLAMKNPKNLVLGVIAFYSLSPKPKSIFRFLTSSQGIRLHLGKMFLATLILVNTI